FGAAAGAFIVMTVGGAAIGVALGLAASAALRAVKTPAFEIALTVAAAFGAYAAGEALHVSGIVAVIGAGLTCSVARSRAGASARATAAADGFWESAALVANSVLFVLVGLAMDVRTLAAAGPASAWGIAAV